MFSGHQRSRHVREKVFEGDVDDVLDSVFSRGFQGSTPLRSRARGMSAHTTGAETDSLMDAQSSAAQESRRAATTAISMGPPATPDHQQLITTPRARRDSRRSALRAKSRRMSTMPQDDLGLRRAVTTTQQDTAVIRALKEIHGRVDGSLLAWNAASVVEDDPSSFVERQALTVRELLGQHSRSATDQGSLLTGLQEWLNEESQALLKEEQEKEEARRKRREKKEFGDDESDDSEDMDDDDIEVKQRQFMSLLSGTVQSKDRLLRLHEALGMSYKAWARKAVAQHTTGSDGGSLASVLAAHGGGSAGNSAAAHDMYEAGQRVKSLSKELEDRTEALERAEKEIQILKSKESNLDQAILHLQDKMDGKLSPEPLPSRGPSPEPLLSARSKASIHASPTRRGRGRGRRSNRPQRTNAARPLSRQLTPDTASVGRRSMGSEIGDERSRLARMRLSQSSVANLYATSADQAAEDAIRLAKDVERHRMMFAEEHDLRMDLEGRVKMLNSKIDVIEQQWKDDRAKAETQLEQLKKAQQKAQQKRDADNEKAKRTAHIEMAKLREREEKEKQKAATVADKATERLRATHEKQVRALEKALEQATKGDLQKIVEKEQKKFQDEMEAMRAQHTKMADEALRRANEESQAMESRFALKISQMNEEHELKATQLSALLDDAEKRAQQTDEHYGAKVVEATKATLDVVQQMTSLHNEEMQEVSKRMDDKKQQVEQLRLRLVKKDFTEELHAELLQTAEGIMKSAWPSNTQSDEDQAESAAAMNLATSIARHASEEPFDSGLSAAVGPRKVKSVLESLTQRVARLQVEASTEEELRALDRQLFRKQIHDVKIRYEREIGRLAAEVEAANKAKSRARRLAQQVYLDGKDKKIKDGTHPTAKTKPLKKSRSHLAANKLFHVEKSSSSPDVRPKGLEIEEDEKVAKHVPVEVPAPVNSGPQSSGPGSMGQESERTDDASYEDEEVMANATAQFYESEMASMDSQLKAMRTELSSAHAKIHRLEEDASQAAAEALASALEAADDADVDGFTESRAVLSLAQGISTKSTAKIEAPEPEQDEEHARPAPQQALVKQVEEQRAGRRVRQLENEVRRFGDGLSQLFGLESTMFESGKLGEGLEGTLEALRTIHADRVKAEAEMEARLKAQEEESLIKETNIKQQFEEEKASMQQVLNEHQIEERNALERSLAQREADARAIADKAAAEAERISNEAKARVREAEEAISRQQHSTVVETEEQKREIEKQREELELAKSRANLEADNAAKAAAEATEAALKARSEWAGRKSMELEELATAQKSELEQQKEAFKMKQIEWMLEHKKEREAAQAKADELAARESALNNKQQRLVRADRMRRVERDKLREADEEEEVERAAIKEEYVHERIRVNDELEKGKLAAQSEYEEEVKKMKNEFERQLASAMNDMKPEEPPTQRTFTEEQLKAAIGRALDEGIAVEGRLRRQGLDIQLIEDAKAALKSADTKLLLFSTAKATLLAKEVQQSTASALVRMVSLMEEAAHVACVINGEDEARIRMESELRAQYESKVEQMAQEHACEHTSSHDIGVQVDLREEPKKRLSMLMSMPMHGSMPSLHASMPAGRVQHARPVSRESDRVSAPTVAPAPAATPWTGLATGGFGAGGPAAAGRGWGGQRRAPEPPTAAAAPPPSPVLAATMSESMRVDPVGTQAAYEAGLRDAGGAAVQAFAEGDDLNQAAQVVRAAVAAGSASGASVPLDVLERAIQLLQREQHLRRLIPGIEQKQDDANRKLRMIREAMKMQQPRQADAFDEALLRMEARHAMKAARWDEIRKLLVAERAQVLEATLRTVQHFAPTSSVWGPDGFPGSKILAHGRSQKLVHRAKKLPRSPSPEAVQPLTDRAVSPEASGVGDALVIHSVRPGSPVNRPWTGGWGSPRGMDSPTARARSVRFAEGGLPSLSPTLPPSTPAHRLTGSLSLEEPVPWGYHQLKPSRAAAAMGGSMPPGYSVPLGPLKPIKHARPWTALERRSDEVLDRHAFEGALPPIEGLRGTPIASRRPKTAGAKVHVDIVDQDEVVEEVRVGAGPWIVEGASAKA